MAQQEDGGGSIEMISPQDYRVYSVPSHQANEYKAAGYVTTDPNINRAEIKEHFAGVVGAGHSFLLSTLGGIPFAKSAIAAASTPEEADAWRESFDAAQREHPVLDFAGRMVGTTAAVAGAVATGGALAGAAGLGGAAAAAGGAEAAGIGLGVDGLAGTMGAAEAATGAATAAEPGLLSLAAPTIRGAAVKGAVMNATLGHIARIDDSALAHAADPAGKEKIVWGLNSDDLLDAALGAATPAVLGTAGKALGYLGKKLGTTGMKAMQGAITNASKMDEIERQGKMADVRSKLEEVLKVGRKNPGDYVKVRVKDAGNVMEDLKAGIKYAALGVEDTDALKSSMRRVLGQNNRLHRRIAAYYEKPAWTIDDMQELNKKIYKEIEHSEPGLRPGMDARFMKTAELVKRGMGRVFQNNDPSVDGGMSQKWASALKDYSDWSLVKAVMKRGQGPKGAAELLNDVSAGAATGFLAGSVFGAFGGPLHAMANSAAYKGVTSLNAYHYGRAAQAMGKVMTWADDKLVGAVEAGLYGVPTVVLQGARSFNKHDYQKTASKVSAAAADPQQAFVNIHSSLTAQGLPDHIAEDAAMAKHAQIQFLASKMPRRMTAPDVATMGQGDPIQQRRFMGQVKTMQDPTFGIVHPTRTNLEVLQRFYPNMLANTQQAVLSQLQRNPQLPSASKQWASRILGRPMNNLSSPSFSSMLQQARQAKADQEAQAQQQGAPRSRTPSTDSSTRLDQLQGGDS